jgi:hypothetical protein
MTTMDELLKGVLTELLEVTIRQLKEGEITWSDAMTRVERVKQVMTETGRLEPVRVVDQSLPPLPNPFAPIGPGGLVPPQKRQQPVVVPPPVMEDPGQFYCDPKGTFIGKAE